MTIVYQDDLVVLHHGDYREHLADLANVGAAAVITDPPYGETPLGWDRWVDGWLADAATIADSLWCFGSFRMFRDHHDEFAAWKFSQDVVWEKHNGTSLANDRFRRVHEFAHLYYRGEWSGIRHKTPTTADATARTVLRKQSPAQHQGERGASVYQTADGGPRLMRSVLKVRGAHGSAIHPTQKPLGIVEPLIEYSVAPGELVVDLFGGSATTGVAARRLGRRALLFEAKRSYADAAARRLESDTSVGMDIFGGAA